MSLNFRTLAREERRSDASAGWPQFREFITHRVAMNGRYPPTIFRNSVTTSGPHAAGLARTASVDPKPPDTNGGYRGV
jgi:hypothetical protein